MASLVSNAIMPNITAFPAANGSALPDPANIDAVFASLLAGIAPAAPSAQPQTPAKIAPQISASPQTMKVLPQDLRATPFVPEANSPVGAASQVIAPQIAAAPVLQTANVQPQDLYAAPLASKGNPPFSAAAQTIVPQTAAMPVLQSANVLPQDSRVTAFVSKDNSPISAAPQTIAAKFAALAMMFAPQTPLALVPVKAANVPIHATMAAPQISATVLPAAPISQMADDAVIATPAKPNADPHATQTADRRTIFAAAPQTAPFVQTNNTAPAKPQTNAIAQPVNPMAAFAAPQVTPEKPNNDPRPVKQATIVVPTTMDMNSVAAFVASQVQAAPEKLDADPAKLAKIAVPAETDSNPEAQAADPSALPAAPQASAAPAFGIKNIAPQPFGSRAAADAAQARAMIAATRQPDAQPVLPQAGVSTSPVIGEKISAPDKLNADANPVPQGKIAVVSKPDAKDVAQTEIVIPPAMLAAFGMHPAQPVQGKLAAVDGVLTAAKPQPPVNPAQLRAMAAALPQRDVQPQTKNAALPVAKDIQEAAAKADPNPKIAADPKIVARAADPMIVAAHALVKLAPPAQTIEAQTLTLRFDAKTGGQTNTGAHGGTQDNASQQQDRSAQSAAPQPQSAPQPVHAQSTQIANAPSTPANNAPPASIAAASSVAAPAQPVQSAPIAASLHVMAANNSAPQPDLGAIAVTIAAKSQEGTKHFDIRLDPPEMGRIDVRLTVDDSGKAQAHLSADHPQTLDMLKRDSGTLERSLKDAGLDLSNNGLNFSLKGQDRQADTARTTTRTRNLSIKAVAAPEATPIRSFAPGSVTLDIRV